MAKLRQFGLLLWKNYLIQKRKVLVTILEIGLPTFFALILIFIRGRVVATQEDNSKTWPSFSIDELPNRLCPNTSSHPCVTPWRLYYAPENVSSSAVMERVHAQMSPKISGYVGFATEEQLARKMVEELQAATYNKSRLCTTLAGVIFTNLPPDGSTVPSNITYKLRFPSYPRSAGLRQFHLNMMTSDTQWFTDFQFPLFQKVGPRQGNFTYGGLPGYMREGFLTLQHNVDKALWREMQPNASYIDQLIEMRLRRFPYPPYNDDNFVLVLQQQFPFILMLSFIFSALHIVKDVVHEKERKLKESMKMMGLSNWLHWSAWFVKYFLFMLISVAIMTTFFCINVSEYGSVVGYTSWSVLLVFLMAYAVATISFSFLVSVFFSKANSGAAAGGILFFITYIPYVFLQPRYDTLTWGSKIGSCFCFNLAMALGAQVLSMFEGTGAGLQWSNISQGVSVDDDFTMLQVILMLLGDAAIYAVLAWYIEAVRPGEYGVPQPWHFPFMKSYWCGAASKCRDDDADGEDLLINEDTPLLRSSSVVQVAGEFFESEPARVRAGIKIQNLRKKFGDKVAVAGMNLNMYDGQISALLGHNGAGKTTTMSMLTGFIPPSSGTAIVNGYDIRRDIASVRQSLGLCPQHNVLFDTLTVEEHLTFFAKLKGCRGEGAVREVSAMLASIGLTHKRHAQTKTLSGGMKRKLSVGIALIGGSKIVILDEPTSGMDPDARRHTWDILQKHREGRTMILTTHFMDEADVLGDRIAIMADGVIQCCGTPLFLKNKYGAGYHMVIVKAPDCDVDRLRDIVSSHVPDARVESNISAELSFILPHESKASFEALFKELEERKSELGIASYGASVTTMEEVFLKVGKDSDVTLDERLTDGSAAASRHQGPGSVFSRRVEKNTDLTLCCQQFFGMFMKRVLHTWRNWLITVTQLLVPLFFTVIALVMIKTMPTAGDSPALALDVSDFDKNVVAYSTSNDSSFHDSDALGAIYHDLFTDTASSVRYVNNLSQFKDNPDLERYLIHEGKRSVSTYSGHFLVAAEFLDEQSELEEEGGPSNDNKTKVMAHFNNQGYHTPAISLNAMDNAVARFATGDARVNITAINHPLPRTVAEVANDMLMQGVEGASISFNVVFGMSFLASSFVLFLIKERALKAKHCQFVSGVHSWTFWASTFCWDLINFLIPCLFIMAAFAAFGVTAFSGDQRLGYILLLFVLYGWAMLPFMYVCSFIFTVPSSGFVWLTMFNIFSGIATGLAVDILRIPQLGTASISRGLEWAFLSLLPNFCLGQGLSDIYTNYQVLQLCARPQVKALCRLCDLMHCTTPMSCCRGHCGDMCFDYQENYLSWEAGGIGRHLIFLAIQGVMYFALLFAMESQLLQQSVWYCLRNKKPSRNNHDEDSGDARGQDNIPVVEDADVATERKRIEVTPVQHLIETDLLVIQELQKSYGNLLAVDRLSLGIPRGECFGLLGVNGAGKTSTFKMLTGDETLSSGNAWIDGFDVKINIDTVRSRLGYCPQFDALIDQLTGRETLTMYARLRGIPEAQVPSVVDELINALLLKQYADVLVQNYSGGNKRKLSTAIALVGNPPIIFLDEPTTGMDPVARRLLWDALSQVRQSGSTIILTSHCMEECEALCTRLAIMVNGQFKCLGSPQHLKNKFGEGYTLLAKVARSGEQETNTNLQQLMDYVQTKFPGSVLKDVHQGLVHYHITDTSLSWWELFGTLERGRDRYRIEDYSISQTTLEQIFLNFARSQIPPQESSPGCCASCSGVFCQAPCLCSLCCGCGHDQELLSVVEDQRDSSVAVT